MCTIDTPVCVCVCVLQYVDLRTRYSELMTLNSQYILFILDTQRRREEDEVTTLRTSVAANG